MLSDGLSLRDCAMSFDLILLETPSLTGVTQAPPPPGTPGLYWSWDGASPDGQLVYSISVNGTRHAVSEENKAALQRAACLYLVTRLDDASIGDAYEALNDVYQLQQTRDVYIPPFTEVRRLPSTEIRHLGRLW
jgi:hypothetical protein